MAAYDNHPTSSGPKGATRSRHDSDDLSDVLYKPYMVVTVKGKRYSGELVKLDTHNNNLCLKDVTLHGDGNVPVDHLQLVFFYANDISSINRLEDEDYRKLAHADNYYSKQDEPSRHDGRSRGAMRGGRHVTFSNERAAASGFGVPGANGEAGSRRGGQSISAGQIEDACQLLGSLHLNGRSNRERTWQSRDAARNAIGCGLVDFHPIQDARRGRRPFAQSGARRFVSPRRAHYPLNGDNAHYSRPIRGQPTYHNNDRSMRARRRPYGYAARSGASPGGQRGATPLWLDFEFPGKDGAHEVTVAFDFEDAAKRFKEFDDVDRDSLDSGYQEKLLEKSKQFYNRKSAFFDKISRSASETSDTRRSKPRQYAHNGYHRSSHQGHYEGSGAAAHGQGHAGRGRRHATDQQPAASSRSNSSPPALSNSGRMAVRSPQPPVPKAPIGSVVIDQRDEEACMGAQAVAMATAPKSEAAAPVV